MLYRVIHIHQTNTPYEHNKNPTEEAVGDLQDGLWLHRVGGVINRKQKLTSYYYYYWLRPHYELPCN